MAQFYDKKKLIPLPNNLMDRRALLVQMSLREVRMYQDNKTLINERRQEQKMRTVQLIRLRERKQELINLKRELLMEMEWYQSQGF